MYGPPGVAYVYLVYGMYDCLNIVTEPMGRPAAVLVRAVEPITGTDAMRAARLDWWTRRRTRSRGTTGDAFETERRRLAAVPDARLASGPGLVAAAFGIDRSMTGLDLTDPTSPLRLEARSADRLRSRIVASPRLGIDYAGSPWIERPWRFAVAGHPSVSGPGGRRRAG
jgi:DNA-3-methyladenine glycosylase